MKKSKSVEMMSFLQEGVLRYADARDTVSAFELQMGQLLEASVRNWSSKQLSPLKVTRIGRAKSGAANNAGYWIAIGIYGKAARLGETEIDCGLWWKVPLQEIDTPIVYVNYYYKPKQVMAFRWASGRQGIQSLEKWKRTFLYVALKQPEDIESAVGRLLKALLKQLK